MFKENLKIKNTLKKLYENQEFESSFEDEEYVWSGDDEQLAYIDYDFRYYIEVGKVLGEEDGVIASINIIITDIKKDKEDYYYDWVDEEYSEYTWYIEHLDSMLSEEMMNDFPISMHLTFYGYDEYDNLPLDQKNL